MRRCASFVVLCTLGVLLCAVPGLAQTETATISGRVVDPQGLVIRDAAVQLISPDKGTTTQTKTNEAGIYILSGVQPGKYQLRVESTGFRKFDLLGVTVNTQDHIEQNFRLEVGSATESVTVTADSLNVNTTDASVSTVVDRQFAENLPMNGRSFQTLIQLTPGVVLTAYSSTDNGQFSVNGQRAASNYWMVDGVSANVGIGTSNNSAGNGLAGANASLSVLGGTNGLVSVDALQEFRIQTSTFAPEFGRTPGGQISIVTRPGTNQWHGSAFDYLRNDVFDANDWFANHNGLPKPKERQNDFGGTLSGPVFKNRTFFFFSYEGLRLRLPQVSQSLVPDLKARQTAVPAMRPFLNAFPLPSPNTPDDLINEIAQFNASFSNSATLDTYSLRIDHKLGERLSVFGRYNYAPSTSNQRGGGTLNSVTPSKITLQTATFGATWTISPVTVNDFRFNYSRTDSKSHTDMDGFGGGVPLTPLPLPVGFDASNSNFLFFVASLGASSGPFPGFQGHNTQRQINLVNDLAVQKGSHNLKFGVDFRRLSPVYGNAIYGQQAQFLDVPSTASGTMLGAVVSSGLGGTFWFHNLGAFAQDTWRIKPSLTMTFGLRWDVDFAPSSNPAFLSVTGFNLSNLSNLALATAGTPPFQTKYGNVAPRIGLAYHLAGSQNWQTVLRGGFGVFFDLATSEAGNSFRPNLYPFGAAKTVFGPIGGGTAPFPLTATDATPPPIIAANLQTIGASGVFDPNLKLPYTLQWNVALEQSLGAQQTLSASYIGAAGRRLLQTALVNAPSANFQRAVNLITNAATSDYDSLQLQFQRRLSKGLQALASYAWSHSIDTASASSLFGDQANALLPTTITQNRGPSDFDIRHAFSSGVTYDVPAPKLNAFTNAVLRGWSIESVVQSRSAPPETIFEGTTFKTISGLYRIVIRPDVVAGQPLYLFGSQYPGGKAFNPAAFVNPPTTPLRQGNMGRNVLRAFSATQWDFAVHRDFPIHESLRLQFRAEMFNILNHPDFAPPVSNIANRTQFGQSTQTLGNFLAGANVGSGAFSPLYQIGGPRSVQFALKLQF